MIWRCAVAEGVHVGPWGPVLGFSLLILLELGPPWIPVPSLPGVSSRLLVHGSFTENCVTWEDCVQFCIAAFWRFFGLEGECPRRIFRVRECV